MDTIAASGTTRLIALLDEGFAWTLARTAAVPADALDAPTPCGGWTLRELLDHLLDTLGAFADAIDGPSEPGAVGAGEPGWSAAVAVLAARVQRGWTAPGAMDRTYETRFGSMPGPVMASANLLEVVVHGWDVAHATGEALDIPDELALPILAFARDAITDDGRGDAFGPRRASDGTPSDQLVAFLGRTPR